MSDLSYRDHCRITRSTGESDKWDNREEVEIYNGKCDYQPGTPTPLSMIIHDDVVWLPEAVDVEDNDLITITPEYDRVQSGIVSYANVVPMEIAGRLETEIGVKQSTEK